MTLCTKFGFGTVFLALVSIICSCSPERGDALQEPESPRFRFTVQELSGRQPLPAHSAKGGDGKVEIRGGIVTGCGGEIIGARGIHGMGGRLGVGVSLLTLRPTAPCLFTDVYHEYLAEVAVPDTGAYRVRVLQYSAEPVEAGAEHPLISLEGPVEVFDTVVQVKQ